MRIHSILVLSDAKYNNCQLQCKVIFETVLKSVYQSNISIPYEVIVVDNYSFDQSCQMIENDFKQIKLFRNKSNLGFKGCKYRSKQI